MKKIVIVGPGAIGCLFAAYLARGKYAEVWVLDKDVRRARKITASGITVDALNNKSFKVKVNITADAAEIKSCDLVIICVKSYDTECAAKSIEKLLGENSHVLTLQNGLGNIEIIAEMVGRERVLAGVTSQGATLIEDGHIRHAGYGDTVIGRLDGKLTVAMRDVRDIFARAGFPTRLSKDINSLIWSKLIINVGINAQTAITRLHNGRLVEFVGTREILSLAVSEAVRVAKKKRIKLIYDDPIQKVESVCLATSANISSMLQDVLKKKKTEIDYINGAIVRQAKSFNLPAPANLMLTNFIKTIESTYDKQVR
ncbi:MAG: 2-dehydropantoate 2-reductase [Candidatus Omnitrophica bacterium]|nr:2-dehydropantoate 2-reductase [Candidatus Omnitrophota bacterium]MBU1925232.1 2-dehydropantoate 2-reductase [Candidatus Omnitrophota bacterium]